MQTLIKQIEKELLQKQASSPTHGQEEVEMLLSRLNKPGATKLVKGVNP
jgi:hypothetical protein